MDKYLSDKLKTIAFCCMVMVVFVHSYNVGPAPYTDGPRMEKAYNYFIQYFISQGVVRTAVPLFFIISGFLFFRGMQGTWMEFKTKITSRFRTIMIPYVLWSCLGLLMYTVMQLPTRSAAYFPNNVVRNYTGLDYLDRLFIHPIPYQLWFLRDLTLLILLTPVMHWLLKRLGIYLILIPLSAWVMELDLVVLSPDACLFFTLGAALGLDTNGISRIKWNPRPWLITGAWLAVLLLKTRLVVEGVHHIPLANHLHRLSILIGVVALWQLYDAILRNRTIAATPLYALSSFSFFLYASHEPLLSIIKKLLSMVLWQGPSAALINYFVAPVLTITLCVFVGFLIKRVAPRPYRLLTGGR